MLRWRDKTDIAGKSPVPRKTTSCCLSLLLQHFWVGDLGSKVLQ